MPSDPAREPGARLMQVLVTGGAGFIGHHLVRGLLAAGHAVSVVDDLSTGSLSRLGPVLDRISFVQGDILEPRVLDAAIAGCEVVLHQAAVASVARSVAEPRRTDEVNVGGTIEIMLAARRAGTRRVVLASSAAVYGTPLRTPCTEDQSPAPTSPYGVTKLAAEHYLHVLGALNGIETVALRYFNVFGPGQDPASEYAAVVPRFTAAALAGHPPTFNGSGAITRDYVYIDDVAAANLVAARPDSPSGLTANIAAGRPRTLRDLHQAICDAVGTWREPEIGPARPGDIPESVADVSLATRALGYRPLVEFGEGIARTVDWYRSQQER